MSLSEKLFWDFYAMTYDRLSDLLIPYVQLHAKIVGEHLAHISRYARILDAGCGTGQLLTRIARERPGARIAGIDRSPAMLKVAKRKLAATGAQLDLHDMSKKLPFNDATFDAVLSTNVLYTLTDPVAHLHDIRRVLRKDGTFVLLNPWSPKPLNVFAEHLRILRDERRVGDAIHMVVNAPTIFTIFALNVIIAQKGKDATYSFFQPDDLCDAVKAAGFTIAARADHLYGDTCCLIEARAA